MASVGPAATLAAQLEHAWTTSAWVLDDLTDDEYWWEPAEPCDSVRPRSSGARGWGSGEMVCEGEWPPVEPVPTTTIAWRVVHLAGWTDIYREWAFTDARPRIWEYEIPPEPADSIGWLSAAHERFLAAVRALDDEEIFGLRAVHFGRDLPLVHIVTSMLVENVHHIAEIGALRDLRRGHARIQGPAPVTGPDWWQGRPSMS